MGIVRKGFGQSTSQGCSNGKSESRGIWKLWISQSCFSLGFPSQNSLWKFFTFRGYKGIHSMVYEECKESITTKQNILTIRARNWNESRANCLARLEVLSCSAPAVVTLQLPLHASHMCHSSNLLIARSNHEALLECTHLELSSHSLTYYPYIIPT